MECMFSAGAPAATAATAAEVVAVTDFPAIFATNSQALWNISCARTLKVTVTKDFIFS